MSIGSSETTYVRQDTERLPLHALRLTWTICFVVCLVFWWFVLSALLS